ncbi:hypothetical protein CBR_g10878 [Chara braunii]|uniref:Uncharacterized protein n=1 Tax=Chara braunii TaxID=69332 RepID=A0A388KPG3_CHABU|nr:hypothetical protein CBR_g10878 [Chara braunii]|eukprot:GBG71941.1 hypothetical protein CBR_g10878 [Chara braunii]
MEMAMAGLSGCASPSAAVGVLNESTWAATRARAGRARARGDVAASLAFRLPAPVPTDDCPRRTRCRHQRLSGYGHRAARDAWFDVEMAGRKVDKSDHIGAPSAWVVAGRRGSSVTTGVSSISRGKNGLIAHGMITFRGWRRKAPAAAAAASAAIGTGLGSGARSICSSWAEERVRGMEEEGEGGRAEMQSALAQPRGGACGRSRRLLRRLRRRRRSVPMAGGGRAPGFRGEYVGHSAKVGRNPTTVSASSEASSSPSSSSSSESQPGVAGGTTTGLVSKDEGVARLRAQRKEVHLVQDMERPIAEYMALPASQYSVLDAERIERVDDNTFRCYVHTLKFFALEVCPVLLVRVDQQPNGCIIPSMTNKVSWSTSSQSENSKELASDTTIEVTLEIPGPFRVIPRDAIESTGNSVLNQLLRVVLPRFLSQLEKDYVAWASGDDSRKPLGTGEL